MKTKFLTWMLLLLMLGSCGVGYFVGYTAGRESRLAPQREAERIQREKITVDVLIEALGAYRQSLKGNTNGP